MKLFNPSLMSPQDRTLLKEIQKSLILYFIFVFLGAIGTGVIFYYKTSWRLDQIEKETEVLKVEKVDKVVLDLQLKAINEKLDDIKIAIKEHTNKDKN